MRCDLGSKVELGRVAEESSRCQMENNDLRLKVDTRATAGHMHVYMLCSAQCAPLVMQNMLKLKLSVNFNLLSVQDRSGWRDLKQHVSLCFTTACAQLQMKIFPLISSMITELT